MISAENIWSEVLGRACGAEAKALPTCSQVILTTGCQGAFGSVLAPAPALLLLGSSSRGAVRRCQKELRQLRSQRENAESCSRTKCAQALTLKSDSLDNYLCETKTPRDKQSQSRDRDTWSGQSRGRWGEEERAEAVGLCFSRCFPVICTFSPCLQLLLTPQQTAAIWILHRARHCPRVPLPKTTLQMVLRNHPRRSFPFLPMLTLGSAGGEEWQSKETAFDSADQEKSVKEKY